jgi:hypothetical protein
MPAKARFHNIGREAGAEQIVPDATFIAGSGEGCVSPFSAVDYRRYAAECIRLAQQVSDTVDKARLLDMAETLRELAEKTETKNFSRKVD